MVRGLFGEGRWMELAFEMWTSYAMGVIVIVSGRKNKWWRERGGEERESERQVSHSLVAFEVFQSDTALTLTSPHSHSIWKDVLCWVSLFTSISNLDALLYGFISSFSLPNYMIIEPMYRTSIFKIKIYFKFFI